MKKNLFAITVAELDSLPDNWPQPQSWPEPGLYKIKSEGSYYSVSDYNVNYLVSNPLTTARPIDAAVFNNPITESLLLKAIAAAASRKLEV